jgi:hypothetical protein
MAEVENRMTRFDQATQRQRDREKREESASPGDRGWKREDLYDRDRRPIREMRGFLRGIDTTLERDPDRL